MRTANHVLAACAFLSLFGATGCALIGDAGRQIGHLFGWEIPPAPVPTLQGSPLLIPPASTPKAALELSDLPVVLDVRTDISVAPVSRKTILGGSKTLSVFDFEALWNGLCENTRLVLFRPLSPGEQPIATLRIELEKLELLQDDEDARCSLSGRFTVTKGAGPDAVRLYSESLKASATEPWSDRTRVPHCVYRALAEIRNLFLDDLDRQSDLVERIASIGTEPPGAAPRPVPPDFLEFSLEENADSPGRAALSGRCSVSCNGWEPSRTAFWGKIRIEAMCGDHLGVPLDRIRVCYSSETFDAVSRRWNFSFEAFPRTDLLIEFNKAMQLGRGIADPPLLNLSADEALERLRTAILREMDARKGIVRFGDLQPDPRYGLIVVPFRLVD